MRSKVYWGLGVLIVLFIGTFVLVMVNEYAENQQLEADANKAQEKADQINQEKNVKDNPPQVVEVSDVNPPDKPVVKIAEEPTEQEVPKRQHGELPDHAKLLETDPAKALKLQSEARGHWSAEWIPPFPPDDLEAAEIAKAVYVWVDYYKIKGNSDKDPRPPEIRHAEQLLYDFNEKFWEDFSPNRRADPRMNDLLKLRWPRQDSQHISRIYVWESTFDK